MCRNPQKAELLEARRTAHGVCLLLFERYCGLECWEFPHVAKKDLDYNLSDK